MCAGDDPYPRHPWAFRGRRPNWRPEVSAPSCVTPKGVARHTCGAQAHDGALRLAAAAPRMLAAGRFTGDMAAPAG